MLPPVDTPVSIHGQVRDLYRQAGAKAMMQTIEETGRICGGTSACST